MDKVGDIIYRLERDLGDKILAGADPVLSIDAETFALIKRDYSIQDSLVLDYIKISRELVDEKKTLQNNLKWLVLHAIETTAISKAKGAELLGISLIDFIKELEGK